jgi:hypothetical protein
LTTLIDPANLPDGFSYPPEFLRVINLGLLNFEPWWIMHGDDLADAYAGMAQRFPHRTLVPFAYYQANDDVACWDIPTGKVVIIHDFGEKSAPNVATFDNFYAWLRRAVEDLIEWEW